MKKTGAFVLFLTSGTLLALTFAVVPNRSVFAQICYDAQQKVIPCPEKKKRPTPTDVPPTKTPIPSPTDTPKPVSQAPDPNQLALACTGAGFVPKSEIPNGGNGGIFPWL